MTTLPAIRPEYRALMMYDALPAGCISFLCTNRSSEPHVKAGEFVVVDTSDRVPAPGELFVIKYDEDLRHHHICMTRRGSGFGAKDGWRVGAVVNDRLTKAVNDLRARKDLSEIEKNKLHIAAHNAIGAWTEGPYRDDGPSYDHLRNCLVGRVIGIYAPKFEGPTRTVGGTR